MNDAFSHSYCHITQFHAEAGDINLWVSGDRFPEFSRSSATWASSWPENARGPRPTTSAVMTRWWIPARHGAITTAGTRSTPSPAGHASP